MKNKKRIPRNMSTEEEIVFWEENDLMDYIDDTREEKVYLSDNLKDEIIRNYYSRDVASFPAWITISSESISKCTPNCNTANNRASVNVAIC